MKIPHRCAACRARHAFAHNWDSYRRKKRCQKCGHDEFFIDTHRKSRREKGRQVCHCDGLWFPHRLGSMGCVFYEPPDGMHDEEVRYMMMQRRLAK